MNEAHLSYKISEIESDALGVFAIGPRLVNDMIELFSECAYSPSEKAVGEFVSNVLSCVVGETRAEEFGLVLAHRGEKLLGALMFRCVGEVSDIDFVGVAKQARGQGLGKKLVECSEQLALKKSCCRMLLEVSDRNVAALATYRSLGYERVSRRSRYYSSGEDALVLEKHLEVDE